MHDGHAATLSPDRRRPNLGGAWRPDGDRQRELTVESHEENMEAGFNGGVLAQGRRYLGTTQACMGEPRKGARQSSAAGGLRQG
jgi:hypothetical protein